MAETSSGTTTDFTIHLPLQLNKSETIAPAPTRSDSAIDWLPSFAGLSWIAYGASSLLVISHFPSPLAHCETINGPVYRQVIELSTDESAVVKGVAWSPAVPSEGEVAVAVENCVCLFSEESLRSDQSGIFCWTQIAVLVQSCAVESIKWTGSGDGIISGGIEVVLWKRKNRTWEIAWKFMAEQPQRMVSATWSTEGPVATAACSNGSSSYVSREESRCVLVCQIDGKSGLVKAELRHPQPASMIQWKPFTGTSSQRDVLLTCCLDGTVRLWCEIDNGQTRKPGKDTNEQKGMRRPFHVVATIEINQAMDGTLGADIFVTWAAEMKDMTDKNEAMKQCFSGTVSECDTPGRCEWLIGFGPGKSLTFWAIHCLDDISPLRFPRVTLWKRLDLPESEGHFAPITSNLSCKDKPLLIKALISRSLLFSPPTTCSLVHLLSDNSMSLSQISLEESKTKGELLTLDSHTGNILQIAVHPYSCEVELAASLDSSGMLLFWSLSTVSKCTLGVPTVFLPTWTLLGKMASQDLSCTEYSSLRWAPSVLNDYRVLLMGHAGGIDCFMIKVFGVEADKIVCHKLCTIPLTGHCHVDGPINIFVIPLSSCKRTFISNNFMLLGVWMKEFQALSWNVTLHSDDSSESSCDCTFCNGGITDYSMWRYDSILDGNRHSVVAVPCSSRLPDPHNHDRVTSAAVLSPANLTRSIRQNLVPSNSLCSVAYLMATGCSDGSLKFWKSKNAELSLPHSELDYLSWELVGAFQAHQGAVSKIALSCCGRKIATICEKSKLDNVSTLCIWESARVTSAGVFLLEDSISLDEAIITIDWSVLGNGQLLLGVCLQNEFRVYAQRINTGQDIVKPGKLLETSLWCCIAFGCTSPPARDFLWGSGSTPVLIHERYFCLFSKWSFCMDKKHQAECYAQCTKDNGLPDMGGTDKSIAFSDCDICDIKNLSLDEKTEKSNLILRSKVNLKSQNSVCNIFPTMTQHQQNSGMSIGCWSLLEVAERLRGPLPIYHPEALLMNLYSGNSKRACVAVRHLVRNLTSDDISATWEVKSCPARPDCIIPQIDLSKYLEEPYSTSSGDSRSQFSRDSSSITSATQLQRSPIQFNGYITEINGFSNPFTSSSGTSEMSGFIETIEKSTYIKVMNSMDKVHMLAVLDLLREVSDSNSAYGSLDEAGRRFWVAVRFQHLYFLRSFGRSPTMDELAVDSSLIGWAFHSDCQDNLLGSLLSNERTWQEIRNLGVGFWFTNATQLRTRMEKLARSQYLKRKDPKDCALLYIALNRLQVLAGLFKISKDEKDKPLVAFLARNFQDEKNKAAALKNAYVLMGRHQLDLAIAFFLLGGDTSSAVTVCAKNLGDEQLALVICRLIEGYGGPLERNLISKFLIPTATEKGDYWFASLLEDFGLLNINALDVQWAMGNYSESFMKLLDFQMDSLNNKSVLQSNQAAFIDPKVGQYCLVLATKNVMKNSIGESTAALLARWARLMTLIAFDRCGLPLEALECLSSSLSTLEGRDEGNISDVGNHGVSLKTLVPNPSEGSNWLSSDVALHLEYKYKLDLASQYTAELVKEHPSWPDTILASHVPLAFKEYEASQFKLPLETFQHKFHVALTLFKQKYSIDSVDMTIMMFSFSCNNGLLFSAYNILHDVTSGEHLQDENLAVDRIFLFSPISKLFLKATEEILCLFARYLMACSLSCSPLISDSLELKVVGTNRSGQLRPWDVYILAIVHSVNTLQATLRKYFPEFLGEDLIVKAYTALDLIKYCIFFASAWLRKDLKVLILMIHPILCANNSGRTHSERDMENLKKLLYQNAELIRHDSFTDVAKAPGASCKQLQRQQSEHSCLLPEDERWLVIGACLWRLIFNFTDQLKSPSDSIEDGSSSRPSLTFENFSSEYDRENTVEPFQQIPLFLSNSLNNTLSYISSYHIKQLGSRLSKKLDRALNVPALLWLEKSNQCQHQTHFSQHIGSLPLNNNDNGVSLLEILWEMCADPKEIRECLSRERIGWSQLIGQKSLKAWTDIQIDTMNGSESSDASVQGQGGTVSTSSDSNQGEFPSERPLENNHTLVGSKQRKSAPMKEEICFQNPDEIYKRNGELVEAICLNSINRQQAALSSSRKGILFFNWKDEETPQFRSEYIWSEADWPRNGWAGSESTPIPTLVSPGIGLGSKKGAHLGLGGATVGLGSHARPGRDLTGGGAFGIPGYAGVGASGLGWGTQENFDESVDPPATIDNITTRALSSHPSRPFFLVGSSNTHVYLWEFGKEKATATYGVLPAANVPPPYALASISALQFDHYGHRFVTAALDGTICTWQLEVGGRSNIRPTESSLCFKKHALDVTYVAGSGSVIAAAGYSPNNVNVVIWDTLAPTTTSQVSLMCHEGGACSVSVFDNDIGSGSISPLIITGGRGGDVGLHDFRFIATGKTKRQRHSNIGEQNSKVSSTHETQSNKYGELNSKGMLWYIPKAHQGSVTKIATIPNTSFFLTGSKDGDVKLWDAKKAELVFHWPKLHERHTFLQPSTRGFGGVVRAAVTDIQVFSHGFLSCGGDGTVKKVQLKDSVQNMRGTN